MPYHCVVCVKQVPDTKHVTGQTMKDDGTVNRAALPTIFNPEDLNALETALRIRDRCGGTVTAVTMGLPKASDVLREALYRGADRAVLVTDRRAAGADTLATGYVLARAVDKLNPDVVLCGRQAIDGDTAQVGPQIAEQLDLTLITYLEELVDVGDGTIRVRRNIGNGHAVVEAKLPVLLTVMGEANAPRPPAARRVMKMKRALSKAEVAASVAKTHRDATDDDRAAETRRRCDELAERGLLIDTWDIDDLGADVSRCGLSGSPTKVHRVQSIVLAGGAYRQFEPTDAGVAELIGQLVEDHTIG